MSVLYSSTFGASPTHLLFYYPLNDEQLLEVTARAVQPVLDWGASGLAVVDGLSNLLKVNRKRMSSLQNFACIVHLAVDICI